MFIVEFKHIPVSFLIFHFSRQPCNLFSLVLSNFVLPPIPRALGGKVTAVKPAGEGSEVLVDYSVLLHFVPDGKPFTTDIAVVLAEVFVVVFGYQVLL